MSKADEGVQVNADVLRREAEDVVASFFAPITGAYQAVVGRIQSPGDTTRKPGQSYERYMRRQARTIGSGD